MDSASERVGGDDGGLVALVCPLTRRVLRRAGDWMETELGERGPRYPVADGVAVLIRSRAVLPEGWSGEGVDE